MRHQSEARWPDPFLTELTHEAGPGPIRVLTYTEESRALSFRPLRMLAGVLAIQAALIAFVLWLA